MRPAEVPDLKGQPDKSSSPKFGWKPKFHIRIGAWWSMQT